jgi:hypothetical protein
MTKRIPFTHEILVQADSGGVRVIVCSEDSTGPDDPASQTHSYTFKGGDAAAKIGDLFLDCSGELYRRVT